MATKLEKICAACNVGRNRKGIMYDPKTLTPYCDNPYKCGHPDHPNSAPNLIKRGSELQLISFEQAEEKLHAHLLENHPDKEKAVKIRRMVTQPSTVRISNVDMAQFLLELMEQNEDLSSISDAIRYCVEDVMERKQNFHQEIADHKHMQKLEADFNKEEVKPDPTIFETSLKKPILPKKQQQPAPQTKDDEEFVF